VPRKTVPADDRLDDREDPPSPPLFRDANTARRTTARAAMS
jgi:hypothetical protein